MRLFFDEDNATGIPKAARLLKGPGLEALEYPSDDPKRRHRWPKGTSDAEWLPWAGSENYLVISQNIRILETPHEFELIAPNRVKIVFFENGHTKSWRVFQVLQSKWKWLDEQWHHEGPFIWILSLNGHVELYPVEQGPRLSRRERLLAATTAADPPLGSQT